MQIEISDLKRQVSQKPEAIQDLSHSSIPLKQEGYRYHIFEEAFRGSYDQLKASLQKYVSYFQEAPEPILDAGCGRGEFLHLMKEFGKDAYGVDLNPYESEQLKSKGFHVVQADILSHLQMLENQSIGGVFCAQVVEHMHPDLVYSMLESFNRVMKPGAPLLIETVNPLSVFGYHHVYFKDPGHIFPVHPDTLIFMMRYSGFQRIQLQLITEVPSQQTLPYPKRETVSGELFQYLQKVVGQLNQLLYGSLEYYVIGYHS
jgi:O-antigen chain-terminating methyltransferase